MGKIQIPFTHDNFLSFFIFFFFFQVVTNAHSGNLSHLPHHLLIDAKPIHIDTKSLILPISGMGQQPHQDKK